MGVMHDHSAQLIQTALLQYQLQIHWNTMNSREAHKKIKEAAL